MAEEATVIIATEGPDAEVNAEIATAKAAEASESAAEALASKLAAAQSEANAKTSETNSATNALAAADSETKAANSASGAAVSASAANGSAAAAAVSETNSAASAAIATAKAEDARKSEVSAASSESNAAGSAASAAGSASAAASSQLSSAASETNAAASALAAAMSEGNAKTAETNSAASAATATGKAAAASISEVNAAQSATNAEQSNQQAAAKLAQATIQADRAAGFAGGSIPVAHSHTTGPRIIEPEYSRASAAFDFLLKRWEYNERRWGPNGTLIEEGTTNLLPAGSDNFVTGWASFSGETITVTDYPVYIAELGKTVIAKRITGNGAGTIREKYLCNISGVSNPHTSTVSCWAMVLSGTAQISERNEQQVVQIPGTMQRISSTSSNIATTTAGMYLLASAPTDIIDVVLYAPQLEIKATATTYIPPGQTRAADPFALPVNAYQMNLLTPNQATGGDTLGNTTGFSNIRGTETVTRDTTKAWNGTGSIKYVCPGTQSGEGWCVSFAGVAGKIYTFSVYVAGSNGTVSVRHDSGAGSQITLSDAFQRGSVTFVGTGSAQLLYISTTTATAATFWIDGLQLEEGTTPSDFTLPAVDYSQALINPTAFSVEFKALINSRTKVTGVGSTFWAIGGGVNSHGLRFEHTNNLYRFASYNDAGAVVTATCDGSLVAEGLAAFKINADSAGFYIWANGTKIITLATSSNRPSSFAKYMYFGCRQDGVNYASTYFCDIRVSGITRTDTECAYVGTPTPDQYTTYCSECRESISSRPYVKDAAGQAQSIITASDPIRERGFINGGFELADRGTSFSNPANLSRTLNDVMINYNGTGQTFVVSQQAATPGQLEVPGAKNFLRYYQSVAPTGQTTNQFIWPIDKLKELSGRKCMVDLYLRSPEAITLPSLYVYQYFGSGGSTSTAVATIANVKTKSNMTRYTFSVTIPSIAGKTVNAGNCIVVNTLLPLNTAFTLDIADFDIYPGTFPRPMPRPTLAALQRDSAQYLQKLPANHQLPAAQIGTNTIDFDIRLPVTMRAVPAPAVTYAETTNWKIVNPAGTQTTGFTLSLLNAAPDRIGLRFTKTSHGMTAASLQLVTDMLLAAEL